MLNDLRHWIKMRRLQYGRARLVAAYDKSFDAGKREAMRQEKLEQLRRDESYELEFADDEIGIADSMYLVRQATLYRIPIPQGEGDWEESNPLGSRFLSRSGAAKLRADLRAEKKARWDYWQSRVTLAASLVGLVGGLMGALAYFKAPPGH